MPDSATGADFTRIMAPYVKATEAQDEALLRVAWPAGLQADVRTLVTADKVVESFLSSADSQTIFSAAQWSSTLSQHMGTLSAAVSVERADLGLAPLK